MFLKKLIKVLFMVENNILQNLEIIELNDSTMELISSFDCGFTELKDFLVEDSLFQTKQSVNKTYLWVLKDNNQLVAYATVSVDAIVLNTRMRSMMTKKGINYKSLPALKIGRLAVRKGFTGKGIGKIMLGFAMGLVDDINRKAGCRFILVDSKNYLDSEGKNPVDFYLKSGFSPIKEIRGRSVPMFLDTMNVIK